MVGRIATEIHISQFEELGPKVASENFVPIRDEGPWKTMQAVDIVEKHFDDTSSSKRMPQGNEVTILS